MSKPEFRSDMGVSLYRAAASDDDVVRAARVSLDRDAPTSEIGGEKDRLIRFLYRNRHMSPFEHGQFTFVIDAPIFVAREFMRHRTFSYNEVSGRYSQLDPVFYLPGEDRPLVQAGKVGDYTFNDGDEDQYIEVQVSHHEAASNAWTLYEWMTGEGIAREVARNVLPVSTFTRWFATVNPRNLMAFLDLRTDPQALHEIREVAEAMRVIFAEHMPLTHAAWAEGGGQ